MERKIALTSGKISWNKIEQFGKLSCKNNKNLELVKYFLSLVLTKKQLPAVAKELLNQFGNLNALIYADKDKLLSIKGIKEPIYYAFAAVREILESTLREPLEKRNIISCWEELLSYLKFTMGSLKIEHFRVLFLNSKNVLLADELLCAGNINYTPVYVREIVRRILFHESLSIVLIHNHPSGDPNPSKADITITSKIISACRAVEAKVLDHIIIGGNKYFSFNEFFKTGVDISSYDFSSIKKQR